jgi:hypothetical protein
MIRRGDCEIAGSVGMMYEPRPTDTTSRKEKGGPEGFRIEGEDHETVLGTGGSGWRIHSGGIDFDGEGRSR